MKTITAVETDGQTISKTFARADCFIVKVDGEKIKTIKNPYKEAVPAGPPVAELVANENPDTVISQNFGGIAEAALREKGINLVTKTGFIDSETENIYPTKTITRLMGYQEAGKKLNYVAGTAAGALIGGMLAGPVGAAAGAAVGAGFAHLVHKYQRG